ncbi:8-AMINO-7-OXONONANOATE SYNTHASE [Salix purpurea]|uniref:8-AMINO-7-OXONONANOATE SYNTHASE n=1 Tax=Salix purpurea TaxID=77065 RepID=A0A9Q1A2P8_SALPP|nr:8-AMINO-7-OXONONANOATE SYNTHASE [Salix purpurea]
MLQAQKVRLTDYLDERSAYLTQFAEKTKAEFDKIGEDARVRLGIGIANSFISSSPGKGKVVSLGAIFGGLINEQRHDSITPSENSQLGFDTSSYFLFASSASDLADITYITKIEEAGWFATAQLIKTEEKRAKNSEVEEKITYLGLLLSQSLITNITPP